MPFLKMMLAVAAGVLIAGAAFGLVFYFAVAAPKAREAQVQKAERLSGLYINDPDSREAAALESLMKSENATPQCNNRSGLSFASCVEAENMTAAELAAVSAATH